MLNFWTYYYQKATAEEKEYQILEEFDPDKLYQIGYISLSRHLNLWLQQFISIVQNSFSLEKTHSNIPSKDEICNDVCTCNEQMNLKCVAAIANEMLQVVAENNRDVIVVLIRFFKRNRSLI